MNHDINIVRIKAVYNSLGDLKDKVVFAGGAAISLYPDRVAFEPRPTDDVDVLIELLNYTDRAQLEEKLRFLGFDHDKESGIVCRYIIQGITVDIMPTTPEPSGFSNRWYPEGFKNAVAVHVDENTSIKILSAPYFIATKLEAFKGRGNSDGRISHDFEDIIFVLENRQSIWDEMTNANGELRDYFKNEFSELTRNPYIIEWIDCHAEPGFPPLTKFILDKMKKLI